MRLVTLRSIATMAAFLVSAQVLFAGESWTNIPFSFHFRSQKEAITNSCTVLSAVLSASPESRTKVQALIGSQVVFVGEGAPPGNNANLVVWSNVLVEVEIRPHRNVLPRAVSWTAEVLGTLKAVDFQKRVIYVRAKPEDWRHGDTE